MHDTCVDPRITFYTKLETRTGPLDAACVGCGHPFRDHDRDDEGNNDCFHDAVVDVDPRNGNLGITFTCECSTFNPGRAL